MKKLRVLLVLALLLMTTSLSSVLAQDEETIVDIAAGNDDFSTLVELVQAAGLAETLSGDGPFTVFAPTNDAFAALPEAAVYYLQNNPEMLTNVLTYHVVEGSVMSADLTETEVPTLYEDYTIDIRLPEDGARANDARIVQADIEGSNGVIHVVNNVLIPPAFEVPAADPLSMDPDSSVISAGSSTVFPVAQRMADLYENEFGGPAVSVESIGSGGGFERFCENGETDLSNASRPIRESEITACNELDDPRFPTGFTLATDALAVTVNQENDFVDNLTLDQLALIFSAEATQWSDINDEWPAEDILLYSPGTDSGTYDFFVEIVLDEDEEPIQNAPNIEFSENDNVLVQGVEGSPYAIGYFGFAYYQENTDTLKAVSVEGVPPTEDTGASGEYPLSRPLFVYADPGIIQTQPTTADFLAFVLNNANAELGLEEGQIAYIPTNDYVQSRNAFLYYVMQNVAPDLGAGME
jgi:phosphate binding protein